MSLRVKGGEESGECGQEDEAWTCVFACEFRLVSTRCEIRWCVSPDLDDDDVCGRHVG